MSKGMLLRPLLVIVLGVISPLLVAAERPQLYSGTLGRMAIVVELDLSDPTQVSGRYFYRKYRHDLALNGSLDGVQLSLGEGRERYDDIPRPELRLQTTPQGWQGEWLGAQGKRLPITLRKALIEEPPAGAEPFWYRLYERSPYEFLRLKGTSLQPGKRQHFMGHELQWWSEPASGVAFFEVLDGYPRVQLDRINQALRERLWQEVISYHACKLNGGTDWSEFQQTVTPRLLSATIVSLSILTSYDCGGAHPDFGDAPLTLNAQTGEPLALEDLLWVGEGPAFLYREAPSHDLEAGSVSFEVFSRYRNQHLAPWLVEQWRRIAPGDIPASGGEDVECNYGDPDLWDYPSWYLSDRGIVFDPIFPRVARACEGTEWSILPYALVKQHPGRMNLSLPE